MIQFSFGDLLKNDSVKFWRSVQKWFSLVLEICSESISLQVVQISLYPFSDKNRQIGK